MDWFMSDVMITDNLPPIRQWSDLNGITLTPAEHELIKATKAGNKAKIGKIVPTTKTDEVLIRAPLLRYLILGGCAECRTETFGVNVNGAWIEGTLDLAFATSIGPVGLILCHIDQQPNMMQLNAPSLALKGSVLPKGLNAERAKIDGGVFLKGISCEGDFSFSGAIITGQLECTGATFDNVGGHALNFQSAKINDSVFLRDVTATGEAYFSGAVIAGQFGCENASFENREDRALNLQNVVVKRELIWGDLKSVVGGVDLTSAHLSNLVDDAASWKKCGPLSLVGLTYDVLHGPINVQERLAWLEKGARSKGEFHPQPYEQLAKVLRESGHSSEAREVLVAKERLQRKAAIDRRRNERLRSKKRWRNAKLRLRNGVATLVDCVFRWTVGYGYKPHYSLVTLAVLVSCAWLFSYAAWQTGDFAPNSDVILISEEWQAFANGPDAVSNPADVWSGMAQAGKDYETFHALAYAVDVVVPLVSLGQEAAWAPSTNRGWRGWHLWWLRWFLIGFGWIATAIGAAAVTGVIRRD
jgi:hypothetical protein